ncbi:hypothetical protein COA01_32275 [Bacillus cereus]|uniref:hypothetical protein n=1 Tax=Bacillus cereus TaxID=1396 RepID=UPI000BFCB386|nr:hypothetical protein [Bacillus cereus]PGP12496.1 hypothetical protein COA01_32275 [Bacillus cereus]
MSDNEYELEDLDSMLDVDVDSENELDNLSENNSNEENTVSKNNKKISEFQKELELLFAEFEKAKAESKEKQMHAKELKDEIIYLMDEKGVDEVIINGLDSVVLLSITYPEREILDRKSLAQALSISQKELSKPEVIIALTKEGKLTTEMIEKFTIVEERMQFSSQDYNPNEE